MLNISIKPEVVFHLGNFPITNTYLTSLILLIIFTVIAFKFSRDSKNNPDGFLVFIIRMIVSKLYNMFSPIFGEKIERFFPYLASLFLFIILSNWMGLLPGVHSIHFEMTEIINGEEHNVVVPILKGATADLNTTLALALFAFILIQYYGIIYCGLKGYLSKFINFANPVAFFTGILETISEFSKIISFAFRLFGNIFAGEVLLMVIAFLIPVLAPFPFFLLELFVGFIQALVFSMLAAVFLQMATSKQH